MANAANGGFSPVDNHPDKELIFDVDSGNGTNVFVGDMVSVKAAGTVGPAAANDNTIVAGVVIGLYDSNGIPCGHPLSSVATKYLPASTAGKAMVALSVPGRRFRGECSTALTSAARFATTDHVQTAGNTTTAKSGHVLNGGDLNSGGQVTIIDIVPSPDNAYGTNQDVIFIFNESFWMGSGKVTGI